MIEAGRFAYRARVGVSRVSRYAPGEAGELAKLVEAYVKALEAGEFDQRLRRSSSTSTTTSSKTSAESIWFSMSSAATSGSGPPA